MLPPDNMKCYGTRCQREKKISLAAWEGSEQSGPHTGDLRRSCGGVNHLAYTLNSRQIASTTPLAY